MARPDRTRRGIALLAAIVTLGVVGTLLVAGYYSARVAMERGAAASRSAQLAADADAAAVEIVAAWDSAAAFRQPVGTSGALSVPLADPGAVGLGWITRVDAGLYWLTVGVSDRLDTTLVIKHGAAVRVASPEFPPDTVHPADLDHLGSDSFATLAARAVLRFPAGASVAAPISNLAYAAGDLVISGGAGSGLLLVAGDVTFVGRGLYRGVILVTGRVHVGGDGMVVDGSVLSGAGQSPKLLPNIVIRDNPAVVSDVEWHAGVVRFVVGPGVLAPR